MTNSDAGLSAVADGASSRNEWVRASRLVQQRLRVCREIELHKWYESERAGRDIGWDRAAVDWLIRFGIRRPDRIE